MAHHPHVTSLPQYRTGLYGSAVDQGLERYADSVGSSHPTVRDVAWTSPPCAGHYRSLRHQASSSLIESSSSTIMAINLEVDVYMVSVATILHTIALKQLRVLHLDSCPCKCHGRSTLTAGCA